MNHVIDAIEGIANKMSRNVEIKARVTNPVRFKELAHALSGQDPIVIEQEDIFFKVGSGRLKLRKFSPERGELIFYKRSNTHGPKLSEYETYKTTDPVSLARTLDIALPIIGNVIKVRRVFMYGQTRIHFDEVKDLGNFMELEVVLNDAQTAEEGQTICSYVMQALEIKDEDLIDCAYIDMVHGKASVVKSS
jgi:predicted adenylyl cyclase CyaB